MSLARWQRNNYFQILKKTHPDLHTSILTEVQKGFSTQRMSRVAEIKKLFDANEIKDKRLFVAVVFKLFHPSLYADDNKHVSLHIGLQKQICSELSMNRSNMTCLIKQVRTWLRLDIDGLRKKTDDFFEKHLSDGKEEN